MINTITEFYNWIIELGDKAPVMATIFGTGATVGVLTAIWQALRRLMRVIRGNLVSSLVISCGDPMSNYGGYINNTKHELAKWVAEYKGLKYSRTMQYSGYSKKYGHIYGIGYGTHYIIWNKSIYIIAYQRISTNATDVEAQTEITIKSIGFTKDAIYKLINHTVSYNETEHFVIYEGTNGNWVSTLTPRDIDSVILNKTIKKEIVGTIDNFIASKEWYTSRCIDYKIGIVLHGEPGTGKTSLIKALASKYECDIHMVSLDTITEDGLKAIMNKHDNGSMKMFVFEDIDSAVNTHNRDGINATVNNVDSPASLSSILNAIDGVNSLNNVILIATTNRLSVLDPALLRPGRFEHHFELKTYGHDEIQEYTKYMYGKTIPALPHDCSNIRPCELQHLVLKNLQNYNGYAKDVINLISQNNTK